MDNDITTDATLGGRFTSKVTPSRWADGWFEIEVTDNETGECVTSNLMSEDDRTSVQQALAEQLLTTHKVDATEPNVERFNLPAAEEANEVNDSAAEDATEGETGSAY